MLNTKVRLVLAATFASTCLSVSRGSQVGAGKQEMAATKQQLQIRLFNLARVSRRDLSRAEGEVTRIFAEAAIEVHWAEGAPDDRASLRTDFSANNTLANGCKVARPARELSVQLLPHAPPGLAAGTLGYSLPCARFGMDATIFRNQCEDVTYQMQASLNQVLAYAIAHELGHVLLRSREHSRTGLMRARWDKAAWLRATVEGITLEREQARRMRRELARMESLSLTATLR